MTAKRSPSTCSSTTGRCKTRRPAPTTWCYSSSSRVSLWRLFLRRSLSCRSMFIRLETCPSHRRRNSGWRKTRRRRSGSSNHRIMGRLSIFSKYSTHSMIRISQTKICSRRGKTPRIPALSWSNVSCSRAIKTEPRARFDLPHKPIKKRRRNNQT